MANAPGGIWSDESMRKIQRDHTRLKSLVTNLTKVRPNESSDAGFMRPLVGVTGTNASYPTYPTSGDTYVVLIDDAYFTPTPGSQSRSLRGTASRYVIARTWDGSSVDEDTPVIVDPMHAQGKGWQWWIRPSGSSGPPTCVLYQFEGYKSTGVSTGTTLAWSDTVKIACFPQRSLGDVSGCGLSIVTSPSAYTDYAFTTTTGGLYLFQFVAHPIDNTSYGSLYVQRTTSGGHTVNVPHGYWSTRTTIRVQYRNSGETESDWIDAAYANGPSIVLPSDGMTQYPRYNAVVAQGVASLPANAELCVRMLSGLSAPTGGTGQPTAGGCTFNAANTADTMNLVITRLGAEESELSY